MEVHDEFLQEETPGRDGSLICRACLRPHPGAEHSRSRHLRRLFVFLRRQRLYSRNERRRGHASEIAGGFTGTNSFVFGAGGGADIGLDSAGKFALRPQLDYFGFRANGSTTNNVRLESCHTPKLALNRPMLVKTFHQSTVVALPTARL